MKRVGPLLIALALTACDALPRDPHDTLARIEAGHVIRLGMVADPHPLDAVRLRGLVGALEARTGAHAQASTGATEPLLAALRSGNLDLVIGPVTADTPWRTDVALGPPIATRGSGDDRIELRAAMRNGENRWIMAVERASNAIAPELAGQ